MPGRTIKWHLITGEYPPQRGGVADYSQLVARGLADAGDYVHTWAPAYSERSCLDAGIEVHRLPGHFGPRALATINKSLVYNADSRVLVQYVPHAFGFKAMNLPFCLWLFAQRRSRPIVMFHEVAYPLQRAQPLRHNLLALVNRVMAMLVARSATRIFVATPAWSGLLEKLAPKRQFEWLPVPSNIPVVETATVDDVKKRYAPTGDFVLGHFGAYIPWVRDVLARLLPKIVRDCEGLTAVLIGRESCEFRTRLLQENPGLEPRIHATDHLEPRQLSLVLSACDALIQPYPDGVCTRRGSMMALAAHGRAVVTTSGVATESLWNDNGAALLVPVDDLEAMRDAILRLFRDEYLRRRYGTAARELYANRFDIRHTITALRQGAATEQRSSSDPPQSNAKQYVGGS